MNQPVHVGAVLAGKYRVEKVLGVGGMGMVVAATHLELDQRVAIKFMLPAALANESATDRFLREARAVVRLRSEHVCRVIDVGRLETGAPYIVMEMLEGFDFAQVLRGNAPLAVHEAVDNVLQALEGVAEAHANGIVHRDLKPANLFVTTHTDGSPLVKVLDFGISKTATGVAMTRTGDMIGSPAYMAPEQMASSKDVDARADIWALGVILYEAVTGRYPFGAETLPALVMNVMQGVPDDLDKVRPGLPRGFGSAVMRCLLRAPGDRHADVAELGAAIAPFGSQGALESAARIARVLRRSSVIGRPAPMPTPHTTPAAMPSPTSGNAAAPQGPVSLSAATQATSSKPGAISTMQASSAALPGHPSRPVRSRRLLVIAAGAALGLLGGGIAIAVMMRDADTARESHVAAATTPNELAPPPMAPTAPPTTGQVPTDSANVAPIPLAPAPTATAPTPNANTPTSTAPTETVPMPNANTPTSTVPVSTEPRVPAPATEPARTQPTMPAHESRTNRPVTTKRVRPEPTAALVPVARLPVAPPTPEIGATEAPVVVANDLPEKLTRMMISPVVARVRYQLKSCVDDLEMSGTVKIRVTIEPDGRVSDVVVDHGAKPSLEKCVSTALKRLQFPKTRTGGVFNQTFSF